LASHLTIMSGAAIGIGSARPFNGQAPAGSDTGTEGPNAFAALLGLAATENETAIASAERAVDPLTGLAPGASTDQQVVENPDVVAVALNAVLPLDNAAPETGSKPLLNDLLASLASLKTKLDAGESIDAEFIQELNGQLDALGEALGIDLTALATLQDFKAVPKAPLPEDASLASKLSAGIAPLAALLVEGNATPHPEAAALGTQAGEKLAALLTSLKNGDIPDEKLAQLGLSAEAEADADLKLAIAKLMATTEKPDTASATPVLAKPALQLSEPVLTGKTAEVGVEPTPTASLETPPITGTDGQDPGAAGKGEGEGKPADDKAAAAAIAAGIADPKPEPQAGQSQQQPAARVDDVAAPRVVQTGYQTSQQQLNLPQIAFELARQTSEGNTRFQIRLDPAELGRIDVQLDIDTSGQVNARLVVEKAETLDLMQRDQRGLEKALHQAGLDSAKTNLEFSLKQNNGGDGQQQGRNGNGRQAPTGNGLLETGEVPPTIHLYRASLSASGVNILA
jgi:flagellar hook-length control protein FliK